MDARASPPSCWAARPARCSRIRPSRSSSATEHRMTYTASRITAAQAKILAGRLYRRAHALQDDNPANGPGELRGIQEALARFETGAYGLCTQCGAPLPLARLGAHPEESRCMECESGAFA